MTTTEFTHSRQTWVLRREVRAAYNATRNDLSTRANHPTYGITKASLWERFYRLEGLIIAHRIVADPDCPPNPGANVDPYAREALNVDLHNLHDAIKNS